MRRHRDLRTASLAAVVCALIAALVPVEVIRVLAALPLTLFLPGFALVAATFDRIELAPLKRLTIEVAASLIVLVLAAFVLNIFPFGLTTASWAVLLTLVVIGGCAVAARRRGDEPRPTRSLFPSSAGLSARSAVLLAAALLIGAGAIALAQTPLPAKHAAGYTALWMLPADRDERALVVGVQSNEQDPAAYRLRVDVGGEGGSRTYRVELDPGEEKTFEVDVPSSAARTRAIASLYREGDLGHLFRRVTRWIPKQQSFP
ncbi:MAG TPA: DUF1616 domain-containing protein [Solirubrobacterales bacterium]|nr:DUF1616 domain-containing protein [Solirubrobacterales bacterium]